MRKSRYTEEQVAFALKQAELGTPVAEVCRRMGVSEATFFRRKQKCGGLGPSELRRLRQLEEGSTKLKKLAADLGLGKAMLRDALAGKPWRPAAGANSSATCRTRSGWANGGVARPCASTARRGATAPAATTRRL